MSDKETKPQVPWLLLFVLASLVFLAAFMQSGSDLSGNWVGSTTTVSGDLVAVNLTIGKLTPGAKDTRLQFGGARSCYLDAEYSGMRDGKAMFSFIYSGGGVYCDHYFPGILTVSPLGTQQLRFEMHSRDKAYIDAGDLSRNAD